MSMSLSMTRGSARSKHEAYGTLAGEIETLDDIANGPDMRR